MAKRKPEPSCDCPLVLPGLVMHVRFIRPILVGSGVVSALDLSSGEYDLAVFPQGIVFTHSGKRIFVPFEQVASIVLSPENPNKGA
jgi:hypothetical protein